MTAILIGQILALSGLTLAGLLFNRLAKLELTLACLLVGFVAGLSLEYIDFDTGIRAHNLRDIVFFVILPVLIFEAAWHLKPVLLRRWIIPILTLATFGVLISCFVTAGIVFFGIGNEAEFPWIAALLTGAILAATDPIAVISKLRSERAPENLTALFEGESLFNDATAIVLFTIVMGFALQSDIASGSSFLGFFSLVFFGGMLLGLIVGLITAILVLLIGNPAATTLTLILSAFASFYIAEHVIHVSGIMAVVVSALVVRIALSEVESSLASGVSATWDWLGLFFNSLLFVIMGLVITPQMFAERWLAMLVAIVASLVARAATVGACSFLTKSLTHNIPMGWQVLLVWGGLRGAIAIALVLSLPVELPYWWTIQSMVFGVVIFSLLIQGSTTGALIRKLEK